MIDAQQVDFVGFFVRDLAEARRFYGEVLGLTRDPRNSNDDFPQYDVGGTTLLLTRAEAVGAPFAPSPGGVAIRVPDVAAARTDLEAQGVAFRGDTIDTGVCHMAVFADPDGNTLVLHHRYAPFADGSTP
ncbi:MAG: VOC family protein [Solirubrobacterales bacterium]|nr:VOC family protein [Solirubrobacterales bacterium]